MSNDHNTKEDEVSFLKARLDFIESQYKSLQLNMKYQREAFIEATNYNFLLKLAPKRYAAFEKLKALSTGRDWRKVMYRHPFKFNLWWTARKLQKNSDAIQRAATRQDETWKNIHSILGQNRFSHIFILPNFARGGGQKYVLQIMEQFIHQNPTEPILVLLNEDYRRITWEEKLPPEVHYLDTSILYHDFDWEERCHFVYRLCCSYGKTDAHWHFCIDGFSTLFLKLHKDDLQDKRVIVYHFCNWAKFSTLPGGQLKMEMDYSPYRVVRDGSNIIKKLVSDNQFILDETRDFLIRDGLRPLQEAICLYTKADIAHQISDNTPTNLSPRLFWISRLDSHKRLNLIFTIAEKMQTLLPEQTLNIHGYSAINAPFAYEKLPPTAKFHGEFDGLNTLNIKPFDILVYTSYFDGLPITILDAIAHGMVVIAPDIAGIGEIIKNGDTGILLRHEPDDDVMADAYIAAIKKLLSDEGLRKKLVINAQKLLRERHAGDIFSQNVKQIFG